MSTQVSLRRVLTNAIVGLIAGAIGFAILTLLPALIIAVITADEYSEPMIVATILTLSGGVLGASIGAVVYPISVEIIATRESIIEKIAAKEQG